MKAARQLSFISILPAVAALILLLPHAHALAAWSYTGNPVCTATGSQTNNVIVEDGEGGFIVIWEDKRYSTSADVFAQRFDADGNALWAADGVPVCTVSYSQIDICAVADGNGGAVIAWRDLRALDGGDIYAQRIDGSGARQWTTAGLAVCAASDEQSDPDIVSDGEGGAIIAWKDRRDGSQYDIYARRVEADGSMPWSTILGEPVCTATGNQQDVKMITDGAGGAYLVWEDVRSGNADIYMQHVDWDGIMIGTADGWAACNEGSGQYNPRIMWINGIYYAVVWMDDRDTMRNIYTQMYIEESDIMTPGGEEICSLNSGTIYTFDIAMDDRNRMIVCWEDTRTGTCNSYVQCFDFGSGPQWTEDGVRVCLETEPQAYPRILTDEDGYSVVMWKDSRNSAYFPRVYAQRFDHDGNFLWGDEALQATSGRNSQAMPVMFEGEGGTVFFTFWDEEEYGVYDLYVQKIARSGYLASPEPAIYSAADVPSDQGGQIELCWYASGLDPVPCQEITHYTIWKALTAETAVLRSDGARMIERLSDLPSTDPRKPVIRVEKLDGATYFWELIDSQEAQYYTEYSKVVETDFTCPGTTQIFSYYQVAAHTADPLVVFTSNVDSACAFDNLSPMVPLGLEGEQEYAPEGLQLTWDPNNEPDLGGYIIHRGTFATFIPGTSTFVASVQDTAYFDGDWEWEPGYWYKVAAYDIHQNVSGYVTLGPAEVTGGEIPDVPSAAYLSQNYPNPFNPSTTISFGLSRAGHVRLSIYDTAGRLVRVLIDEDRGAGRYAEHWDGLTQGGLRAASGVYFYRLASEDFTETRKMVLLK